MAPQVYLISGTARGIGLGIVRAHAKHDNVIVFAGARKPSSDLEALAAKHPDKVKVVKVTSGDEADNKAAVAEIQRVAGRLDVVIANAAIGFPTGSVLETPAQAMAEYFAVNTIVSLVLFKATYPLLKASSDAPKLIPISSVGGSITYGAPMDIPTLAYGMSKATLDYLAIKIRADHEGLISFPICPGAVSTDMSDDLVGGNSAQLPPEFDFKSADESAEHILARIDEGTRKQNVFVQWDRQVIPW